MGDVWWVMGDDKLNKVLRTLADRYVYGEPAKTTYKQLRDEINRLRAENERLRAELERVHDYYNERMDPRGGE